MNAPRKYSGKIVLAALAGALLGFCPQAARGEPWAEFQAAKQREATADAAVRVSREALDRALAGASAAAAADQSARERQVAELDALNARISAAASRIVDAGQRPAALDRELAVLQYWYGIYQRTPANLTERSFLGLEAELAGLAGAGLIDPGLRTFTRLIDVRAAIQRVQDGISAHMRGGLAAADPAKAEVARLAAERDALLARIVAEDPGPAQAAGQWSAAAGVAARDALARLDAQEQVLAAYERVAESMRRERPPALIEVIAMAGGSKLYEGGWSDSQGATPDERARQDERAELLRFRNRLDGEILTANVERRGLNTVRLEIGEKMMTRSRLLEAAFARQSELRQDAILASVAADIGLTVAELFLTGGSATLARKTAELAEEAAARSTARSTAKAMIAAANPAERAVLREFADNARPTAETVARAVRRGEAFLREKAPALRLHVMARGMAPDQAARVTEETIRGAMARLRSIDQIAAIGNRAGAERIALANQLEELAKGMPELAQRLSPEVREEFLKGDLVERVASTGYGLASAGGGVQLPPEFRESDLARDALVGEGFETGAGVAINIFTASVAPELAGVTWYTAKFGKGLSANVVNTGIGVVSSAMQVAVAKYFDVKINAQQRRIETLWQELKFLNETNQGELQKDEYLASVIARLARLKASVDRRLAELDAGFAKKPAQSATGKAVGEIRLDLAFSGGLAAAPSVRLGRQAVTMASLGGDGRRWSGTVSAAALGAGTHTLEVAIDRAASPHGALDANPATPPMRDFARGGWRGFEAGVDRAHAIRLEAVPSYVALLIGRWTYAREGGVIETAVAADGTMTGTVVTLSARMRRNGFTEGMQILRGYKMANSGGTWLATASQGQYFIPAEPNSRPGQVYYDTPTWSTGGSVISIAVAVPDRLSLPATIENRLSDYQPWTRVTPRPPVSPR